MFDWAWRELPYGTGGQDDQGWGEWLLVRRNIEDPTDLAYYLVFAPRTPTILADVVCVVGVRWDIEVGFETAKGDCGLEDYEVRTWDAWHRHITLALLAHAFLVVMRTQSLQKKTYPWMMVFRSQCQKYGVSFGNCSGHILQATYLCSYGHDGVGDTNGAHNGVTNVVAA